MRHIYIYIYMWDNSDEGFKVQITHFKKARAIYNLVSMTMSDCSMTDSISELLPRSQWTVGQMELIDVSVKL
jgi:hypothetical protein